MTVSPTLYRKPHPARLASPPRPRSGKLRTTVLVGLVAVSAAVLFSALGRPSQAQFAPPRAAS